MDTTIEALTDCADVIDASVDLGDAISASVPTFGGKATNMAAMTSIGELVPTPPCFAIPVHHYDEHITRHGRWDRYAEMTENAGGADPRGRALAEGGGANGQARVVGADGAHAGHDRVHAPPQDADLGPSLRAGDPAPLADVLARVPVLGVVPELGVGAFLRVGVLVPLVHVQLGAGRL